MIDVYNVSAPGSQDVQFSWVAIHVGRCVTELRKYIWNFLLKLFLELYFGLGSESPRTHLSPCVLFRYNTMLNIVVRGDSEPIPTFHLLIFFWLVQSVILSSFDQLIPSSLGLWLGFLQDSKFKIIGPYYELIWSSIIPNVVVDKLGSYNLGKNVLGHLVILYCIITHNKCYFYTLIFRQCSKCSVNPSLKPMTLPTPSNQC